MVSELWILLAIMNGQNKNGKIDVMINHQRKFETKYECRNFIKENAEVYNKNVLLRYNYKKKY